MSHCRLADASMFQLLKRGSTMPRSRASPTEKAARAESAGVASANRSAASTHAVIVPS